MYVRCRNAPLNFCKCNPLFPHQTPRLNIAVYNEPPTAMTRTQYLKSPPACRPADGLERFALSSKRESIEAIDAHKLDVRGIAGQIEADDDDKVSE